MEPSILFTQIQERLAARGKDPLPDKELALSRAENLLSLWWFLKHEVPELPAEKEDYDLALERHMSKSFTYLLASCSAGQRTDLYLSPQITFSRRKAMRARPMPILDVSLSNSV